MLVTPLPAPTPPFSLLFDLTADEQTTLFVSVKRCREAWKRGAEYLNNIKDIHVHPSTCFTISKNKLP
jgi:hypothetical protein